MDIQSLKSQAVSGERAGALTAWAPPPRRVTFGNERCFVARMWYPHHRLIAPLISIGWVAGVAYAEPPEGIDAVSEAGTTIPRDSEQRVLVGRRSLWRSLEISTSRANADQDTVAGATGPRPQWQDASLASRPAYGWMRNELGIGFSNRGVLDGFVRWRAANADPAVAPPGSYTLASDPAALASYRGQRATLCCLPELAPPSPAEPRDAHVQGASSMVSLVARLRTKGLDLDLPDAWKINAGVRSRDYSSTLSSRLAHVTVDRYWGDLRTSYSFQIEKPNAWRLAPSHKFSLDYAMDPRNAVGLSFTSGREMAFFGSLGAVNTEVRGLALHAEHSVRKDWSFSFSAGYFDHGAMPSHKTIHFGFRCSL